MRKRKFVFLHKKNGNLEIVRDVEMPGGKEVVEEKERNQLGRDWSLS